MTIRNLLTKDVLFTRHIVQKETALDIAKTVPCTGAYVCMLLKEYGIKNLSNSFKIGKASTSSTCFKKGIVPWNKGKNIPSPNKGKKFPRGKDHWNYKKGPSKDRRLSDPFYRDWRTEIFKRDNYTCIFCGINGGLLNADHIKPWALFPELRYSLENGRTLCLPCHRKTPTYGGRTRKSNDSGTLKSVLLA